MYVVVDVFYFERDSRLLGSFLSRQSVVDGVVGACAR